jgi:hypothetical protein
LATGETAAQDDKTLPAGREDLASGSLSSLRQLSVTVLRNRASGEVRVAVWRPKERDLVIALRVSIARAETSSSFPLMISKRIVSQMEFAYVDIVCGP